MKKFMILGALVALVVTALALPALAQDRNDHDWWNDWRDNDRNDHNWWNDWRDNDRNDHNWWSDWRDNDRHDNDNRNDDFVPVVSQETEQEAESGDVQQSFNVSSTGDNSNQCAGIQGVANTGNAQNQIGVIQYGSEADDFEFDEVGSTITVSPSNTTSCDQQVNQAASASGW